MMNSRSYKSIKKYISEYLKKTNKTYTRTYSNIVENAYLFENEVNYRWLMDSKRQLENGRGQFHNLYEDK